MGEIAFIFVSCGACNHFGVRGIASVLTLFHDCYNTRVLGEEKKTLYEKITGLF